MAYALGGVALLGLASTQLMCAREHVPVLAPNTAIVKTVQAKDEKSCEQTADNGGSRPNCLKRFWNGSVCVVGNVYSGCDCYEGQKNACPSPKKCKVLAADKCKCQ